MFVAGDEITGVTDWSEASQGDALYDLAILTLGHEEHPVHARLPIRRAEIADVRLHGPTATRAAG